MAIKYYPNRIYKPLKPAIDNMMAKRDVYVVSGRQDLSVGGLSKTISPEGDWQVNSILFKFDSATARTYYARIVNGRRVVENLNDSLWFQMEGTLPQLITLDAGFYVGTELANHLKVKLDANTAFAAKGVTFLVIYDTTTGLFTITPSSGTIRYLNINTKQTLRTMDSIAGHLFGFEVDTAFASSITSDTAVFALNSYAAIISEAASTVLEHYHDDIHILSLDQSVRLMADSGAAVVVDYTVSYERIS